MSFLVCFNLSNTLFLIGLFGIVWNRAHLLVVLLCIELMFFGVSLHFVFFSIFFNYTSGQLIALLLLVTAATEGVVGLSLLVLASRLGNNVQYETFIILRG